LETFFVLLSFCSGIFVSADKLRMSDDAPKIPERRGSSTCGSWPRGEVIRLSRSKAKMPRKPLVKKSKAARTLYFQCTNEPCPSIQGPLSALIMRRAMASSNTPTYLVR